MPESDSGRVDGLLDQVLDVKLTCDAAQFRRGIARLRLSVLFRGPWERIEAWLLGLDEVDVVRRLVVDGSVRERAARWVAGRDVVWQDRHIRRGRDPRECWRRRPSDCGLDAS